MKNGGLSAEGLAETFTKGDNAISSPATIKGTRFISVDSSSTDTNSTNKSETK
jgi:hypothetical protein